jgi:hypothetical protein
MATLSIYKRCVLLVIFLLSLSLSSWAQNPGVTPSQLSSQKYTYGLDTGVANAYAVSLPQFPYPFVAGQTVSFLIANTNTGASTLSINSNPTSPVTKQGNVALAAGDFPAGAIVVLTYDGTNWQLTNTTRGIGGGSSLNVVLNEVPSGSINGSNVTFTIAHTPQNGVISLFHNGVLLKPGSSFDYTISGTTITLNVAPIVSDNLTTNYFY